MAGVIGGGGAGSDKTPKYTGVQIQTSSMSTPIPIVYGANKITFNIIDYFDFRDESGLFKGKGGGKGGSGNYYADVVLALCEGNGQGTQNVIGSMWANQGLQEFSTSGFGFYPGNETQEPWASAEAAGHGLSYAYTTYIAQGNLALGQSAEVPSYWFEMFGIFHGHNAGTGIEQVSGYDANLGDIIPDLLTNQRYGMQMDPSLIVGADDLRQYHLASTIFVSPVLREAEQVTSILQRWGQIGNFWSFWNGTQYKIVPLADTPIIGNGVTYTPDLTVRYNLGPDDFQVATKNSNKNDPPVKVTRKDPADCYNFVQLDCHIRSNYYDDTPFIFIDQPSVDLYGFQSPSIISAEEICNNTTANIVLPLVAKRILYVRNTYEFTLLPTFILLEPGDIVSLTDPNIGLSAVSVRITDVDEDDTGNLKFKAEEFSGSVATVAPSVNEPWAGGMPYNSLTPPNSVNTPAFWQPDLSITQGTSELWIALSGGTNWGGCGVFLSFDGVNYVQIGECGNTSIQGTLTAGLPFAEAGSDTADALDVDTTESQVAVSSNVTSADATALRTLAIVDNEVLAYGAVMPTGEFTAAITDLVRGVYGTTPESHATGAMFSNLDPTAVFTYAVPTTYYGKTLYFKFPSVNSLGNQAQTLDECTEYTFVPAAPTIGAVSNVVLSPPALNELGQEPIQAGTAHTFASMDLSWSASPGPNLAYYQVQFSLDGGNTWSTNFSVDPTTANPQTFTLTNPASLTTYVARVRAVSLYTGLSSAWVSSNALSSEAAPVNAPAVPTLTGFIVFRSATDTGIPAGYGFQGQNTAPYPTDYSITAYTLSYESAAYGLVTLSPVSVDPQSIVANGGVFAQILASNAGTTALPYSTTFTFTLTATNAAGTSIPSAPLYLSTGTSTQTSYP